MLKVLNEERVFLANMCVLMGLAFWKGTERFENWSGHSHTKIGDGTECTNCRGISLLSSHGNVYAKFLEKKLPRNNFTKGERYPLLFRTGRVTADQTFNLQQIFENFESKPTPALWTSRENTTGSLRKNLSKVLLLEAVESFAYCGRFRAACIL